MCAELDRDSEAFRTRGLEGEFPTCSATPARSKRGVKGRVVSRAVVVAIGVSATGYRRP